MRSLREAVGRELAWKPRSLFSRTHELVDESGEGEPYATLVWRPGLLMRGPAEASSADGAWQFRHLGWFRAGVLVLAADGVTRLGTLRRHWRRGVLRFEDGREFTWRRASFWSPVWRFEDANGTPVVRFRWRFSFPRGSTRVDFESSSESVAELALLVCLGWYLVLDARRRAAAHAAA